MAAEEQDDLGQDVLRFGERMVDLRREVVVSPTGRTKLTTNEALLLRFLAQRPGQSVAREVLLEEVWGYSRTVRSRAVDQTVKRLRPKIEVDSANPQFLITVHAQGYRLELPPTDAPDPEPALPIPSHACLGRDEALASIEALVEEGATILQLVGPPGMGKSRLALAWASAQLERVDRWPGGVQWVDLAGIRTEAALEAAVDLSTVEGPSLLVLDDVDDDFEMESSLREWASKERTLLLTCRRHSPHLPTVTVEPLGPAHAEAMLCERAPEAASAPAEEREKLLDLLCGNPLAIELAGSRLSLLGIQGLARRLQKRPQLLSSSGRGTSERHGSLWGAINLSFELLDPAAATALLQAAVFAGAFTLEAAEAVIVVDGAEVVDVLQELQARSLVHRTPEGLSLFGTVRQFAIARLMKSPHLEATQLRHRQYFQTAIDDVLSWRPAWGSVAIRKHEVSDILDATREAGVSERIGGMLAAGLIGVRTGERATWTRLLEGALQQAREACAGPPVEPSLWALLARSLIAVQSTRLRDGGMEAADEIALEAVASADRSGQTSIRCWARVERSRLLRRQDAFTQAEALLTEALAVADEDADLSWAAFLLYDLGRLRVQRGNIVAALQALEQARDRFGSLTSDDPEAGLGEALPLYALGYIALEYGRTREAETYFQRAIDLFERAEDARANDLVHLLGLVALDRGDFSAAEKQFLQSAAHSEATGDRRYLGEDRLQLALIDHLCGSLETASEGYRCAAAHLEAVGHQQVLLLCWSMHAALMAKQGLLDQATARLEEASAFLKLPEGSAVRVACEASAAVLKVEKARANADLQIRAEQLKAAEGLLQRLGAPREQGDEDNTAWVSSSHMVRQATRLLERALGAG
jgi:DNA-binding winged helix-turn-helix (wHTH) protein/predicted ATPase/tetratricopeptide (TPR) repeat protein